MEMKKIFLLSSMFLAVSFFSCSSSVEETREEEVTDRKEETYVFDEIPETGTEIVSDSQETYYLVQIGAFTTKQSAEDFAGESKKILGREVSVSYSNEVNLFVVRIDRKFINKSEADKLRDDLRFKEEFKDAWVVSETK